MRVHRNWMRDGELIPGAIRDRGDGMSTDWSKYSTPIETQQRASEPAANGVVSWRVVYVRSIGQSVNHTPRPENRAHADVIGAKDVEVRLKLLREIRWEINPPTSAV
jgi:hypothetical protein